MKITIITVATSTITNIIKVEKQLQTQFSTDLQLELFYAARQMSETKQNKMIESINKCDVVIIDLMGTPENIVKKIYKSLEKCSGSIIPIGNSARQYMRLGKLDAQSMSSNGNGVMGKMGKLANKENSNKMEAMKKMANMSEKMGKIIPGKMRDMRNLSQISKYFNYADEYNLLNMILLILKEYGGQNHLPEVKPAREIPQIGLCDPKNKIYYDNFNEYTMDFPFNDDKPTVGVMYYGHTYPNDTSFCVNQIVEKIRNFANVIPLAFSSTSAKDYEYITKTLKEESGKPVDAIINFMSFRLGAGPMGGDAQGAIDVLEDINAVYMHPFFMSRRQEHEWKDSIQGINSSEFTISVMLPEFDGCVETMPIGAMCTPVYNEKFDVEVRQLKIIEERANKFCGRLKNQLKLKTKKNKDKNIAIICYNYPPGESNLFGGSFLDTLTSIENLLINLKAAGYSNELYTKDELIEKFTIGGLSNTPKHFNHNDEMIRYPVTQYLSDLNNKYYKNELISQWGDAPGDVMSDECENFLMPGIISGNVFIGLQPSRGYHEHQEKLYHDKELLPHHQYLAFYKWLRDEFCADAMIHVGTHGTLEFTRGKECGMSGDCFPDILVSDIPHMYLYYCGNPSEAMIAKRRSHANLIGYQPPEYIRGQLYGEFVNLNAMIDEYRESLRASPVRSEDILKNIIKIAKELNLPDDLDEIELELYRMNRSLIPKGLHVFGKGYDLEEAKNYVKGLLRYERDGRQSLMSVAAQTLNIDYDNSLKINNTPELSAIDIRFEEIFNLYYQGKDINELAYIEGTVKEKVRCIFEYADKVIEECMNNYETKGLLKTLDGRYNPAKLAGDIFRNPEVMPTGYNLYQFDPRFVPSETAFKRGKIIAENTLEQYNKEEGKLPDTTAVILWGLETSRTQGETVGQILTYLGVRPKKKANVWETNYEVIPLDELGRKRVDVVINICGFFRDMFPNIIDDFNKIFNMLAELDEPDDMNSFSKNSKRIYEELINKGYEIEEAKELSRARIFGPEEGQYGTGLTGIIQTKNWENEEQLGTEFIKRLKHVYSTNNRGRNVENLYNNNLSSVEVVSQIRSNHEYEITDLDHYYEFVGGLAKSVEITRGKKVKVYITDTTDTKIRTEGIEKSISRGIRTRVLNPKWIDGMLEHKYHGVQKIADRFENVMGLAATTGGVDQWIYDDLYKEYIENEQLRQRLKENNPYAYLSIIEQMMEYDYRGYWNATEEQRKKLKGVYLELEGDIEEKIEVKINT